jgi:ABC-type polar amino acid transport system ATPase subunit
MYDEPTAGLDPVASTVVEDLVRSLHAPPAAGNGARAADGVSAYIVVTHQHSTIRRSVDRLIFLHKARARGATRGAARARGLRGPWHERLALCGARARASAGGHSLRASQADSAAR